jgi:hypothetical protein
VGLRPSLRCGIGRMAIVDISGGKSPQHRSRRRQTRVRRRRAACLGDGLKLMPVVGCGQWGTLDVGGLARFRYHHERGMRQEPDATWFQGTDNGGIVDADFYYTQWTGELPGRGERGASAARPAWALVWRRCGIEFATLLATFMPDYNPGSGSRLFRWRLAEAS